MHHRYLSQLTYHYYPRGYTDIWVDSIDTLIKTSVWQSITGSWKNASLNLKQDKQKKRCQNKIIFPPGRSVTFQTIFVLFYNTHRLWPVLWVNFELKFLIAFIVIFTIESVFFLAKSEIVSSQQGDAGYNNCFYHLI